MQNSGTSCRGNKSVRSPRIVGWARRTCAVPTAKHLARDVGHASAFARCATADVVALPTLRRQRSQRRGRALQLHLPGFADEIDTETVVLFFRDATEAGVLINATRGEEGALGPQRH